MLHSRPFLIVIVVASVLGALLSSGCATIGHDARNQAVLVQSDPPGATIVLDGKTVGQAPMYVLVPREKHPKLTLSRDGISKDVEVETNFRWGSFFENLVFYIGAPIGWAVDYASGSSWNPQDPAIVSLKPDQPLSLDEQTLDDELPPPKSVAIAPPRAESLELSNVALPVLQDAIRERKNLLGYSVAPYEESLPLFLARGYDYDGDGSNDETRMLYQSLNTQGVWHSKFYQDGDVLKLNAQLEDTRTHATIDQINFTLDAMDERSQAFAKRFHLFALPNTLTFSLSTQYFTYDRPDASSISLQAADTHLWWQKGLQYLSQISITNFPDYRPDRSGRFSLNFIPMLKLSRRDLVANGTSDIDGKNFTRWLGAIGYGPEIGYQVGRHYFYVDLDFNAVWTNIDWTLNGQDYSVTQTGFQTSAEIGYLYQFTDIWSLRLYGSSFPENATAWREALNKSSTNPVGGQAEGVANNSTVGISVGFSYEPFLVRTFREKIRKAPLIIAPTPYQAALPYEADAR